MFLKILQLILKPLKVNLSKIGILLKFLEDILDKSFSSKISFKLSLNILDYGIIASVTLIFFKSSKETTI